MVIRRTGATPEGRRNLPSHILDFREYLENGGMQPMANLACMRTGASTPVRLFRLVGPLFRLGGALLWLAGALLLRPREPLLWPRGPLLGLSGAQLRPRGPLPNLT